MSEKENVLQELTRRIGDLHRLLGDPHPGLYTWQESLYRQVDGLIGWWNEPTQPPAPSPEER